MKKKGQFNLTNERQKKNITELTSTELTEKRKKNNQKLMKFLSLSYYDDSLRL